MPAFDTAGSPISSRITFNSGYIDFGNNRLVQVDKVSIDLSWTINDLFVLNSIIAQDKARSTTKVTLDGTIMSFAPEMEYLAYGSSTTGTPSEIDILDGQPTLQSPVVTLYDRNGNQIQYQLTGAIFKSSKMTSSKESYGAWDFSIEAKSIKVIYTA